MRKGFYWVNKNWYYTGALLSENAEDRITIGVYPEDGGTQGEFSICWKRLGKSDIYPKLSVWDYGWKALSRMPDLIQLLGALGSKGVSVEKFVESLKELGYIDLTEYERNEE